MKIENNSINLKQALNLKFHEEPWTELQKKLLELLGFKETEVKKLRVVTEELNNFFEEQVATDIREENNFVRNQLAYYELKTVKAIEYETSKDKKEIKATLTIFYSEANGQRIKKKLNIYLKLKGGE